MNLQQDLWTRALACYHEGRFRQADKLLKKRYRKTPIDVHGRLLCGMVAAALENWREAHEHLSRAVKLLPEQVEGRIMLGNAARALNRMDEAIGHYQQALQRQPSVEAWHNLAATLEDTGDLLQALSCYERALQLDANYALSLRNRAPLLARLRRVEAADAAYDDLRQRYPNDAGLRLAYASWLEQSNRTRAAGQMLPDCSDFESAELAACESLRAQLLTREGKLDAALARLTRAHSATRCDYLGFRMGRLYDRLGRYDDAWRCFNMANRERRKEWRFARLLQQPLFEFLHDKLNRLAALDGGQPDLKPGDPQPVFLMGLPRSGTTLLNRLLDLHPSVQVLEETHALRMAADEYERSTDVEAARDAYWKQVAGHADIAPGACVIDKHPFHAMHLAVLPALFPGARVIYLHREPLDAALSCYMQDFDPGPVSVRFTDLEESGRVCQAFIQLMDAFSDSGGATLLHVHYERLVTHPVEELARVFEFLRLEWDAESLDIGKGLDVAEPVMTASYDQVIRPIYRESIGRWRAYAGSIEVLRLYLDGYGSDDKKG